MYMFLLINTEYLAE